MALRTLELGPDFDEFTAAHWADRARRLVTASLHFFIEEFCHSPEQWT